MNNKNDTLLEAATKILTGQINENKKVTSEKSQFGGFRPKIVNGDGSIFFLGSQAFKTSQGAEKAAQYYLDQYVKGVNVRNIKMMKGDYVKESSLEEKVSGFSHPEVTKNMLDIIDEFDADDVEALLKHMIDSFTYPHAEDEDVDLLIKNLKRTLRDWKNRSSN